MRSFDVVVWGCTGFTGKLTCEYLNKTYPQLKWAIGGRNAQRVNEVKNSLNLKDSVEVLIGDISNEESLLAITSRTKVVLTTAGPYAVLGKPMVKACIDGGAHYCDLTGEAPFIRMIADEYFEIAKQKKLRIVNCCGFDCIPCDLGTLMMNQEIERRGLIAKEVRFLVHKIKGGASGGTIASVLNIFESLPIKELMKLANPFYLNPPTAAANDRADKGNEEENENGNLIPHVDKNLYKKSCDNMFVDYDSVEQSWTMPYVMQAIDLRVVNRSNALMGWKYGRKFVFSERMKLPNVVAAVFGSLALLAVQVLFIFPPSRMLLKPFLPSPGQGPNKDMLDNGFFQARLWGLAYDPQTGEDHLVKGSVEGKNGDPGYRLTAEMIAESAVCLALDTDKLPDLYGILTPSSAMGSVLMDRLNKRNVHFNILP